jgi:hypothetical protein
MLHTVLCGVIMYLHLIFLIPFDRFQLVYEVDIGENDMKLTLTVNNKGNLFLAIFDVCNI